MKNALVVTGFASIKALKQISDDDIEEIKRNANDWRLGELRQLKQLSSEIDEQEQSFLDELTKIKKKKAIKRKSSAEIEENLPTPNGNNYIFFKLFVELFKFIF